MEQELSRKEYREDRALVKRLKAGNHHAWSQFYDRYASPLFRFVMSRVYGHEEVVADVTQDVIVVAMERIATYDPRRGSLWVWLCGIAVNKGRESLHTRMRDSKLQERIKNQPPVKRCNPSAETGEALDIIVLLNPRHQEVLSLKYMDGYSVLEIAERLKLSAKAVESRLTRARGAFRKAHEEQAMGGTAK